MRFATLSAIAALLLAVTSLASAEPVAAPASAETAKPDSSPADSSKKPTETTGKIEAVTVYRGQALITRGLDVKGPVGLKEVIVTALPDQVLPGSIYAESADGVEVRSVRYRVRPVGEDVREEVRKIEEQIAKTEAEIAANERYLKLAAEHKAYLDSLQKFVAATANVELTKGVLDAETLQTLTEFIHAERKALAEEELTLQQQKQALQETLNLLQRGRQTVASGSAKTVREAVVFVKLANADGGSLRVRYIVDNATWSPSYNLRTDAKREQVLVEYNASVQQMTGEDWNDVAMTLSTATPSLVATAPDLNPLKVTLKPQVALQQAAADAGKPVKAYSELRRDLEQQRKKLDYKRNSSFDSGSGPFEQPPQQPAGAPAGAMGMGGMGGGMMGRGVGGMPAPQADSAAIQLNSLAGQIQMLELKAGEQAVAKSGTGPAQPEETVSVTYQLESAISLPSRSDRQLIQIASLPMTGEFRKIAVPVLTAHVYEQAEVANSSDLVLLAGPSSSFVAGRFVGHGELPTVTIGEEFTVGFGIDSSLRANRELVDKNETIQGGNRVVDFTYRLSIENFGAEPATVRLTDRIPTSSEDGDINVTLVSPGQPLSDDPEYQKNERKKGILRWIVEVPAEAIGPKAFSFEYQFKMEYDKQMSIAGLASEE